ncbi:MAG: hypothetical protein P1U61_05270 [Legionellaceae bacterium]|nr:hypothetical protein [Legionellaceae bacterium]
MSHHEGTPFSTEETHEFYTNLGLFKAHPLTPEHDGIFFIGDDYMYLVAVCWCRWLDSLSEEVRKELNLATLRETLHTQISRYTPNKREFPLLFKDEVSMEEVVADLEYRFKKIYHDHKERVDNISDNQLRVYTALRCLGYLLALSLLVTACSVMAPGVGLVILFIFLSPAVAVGAHLGTRVNATISQQSVQENNMKYHESQSAIAKEFPDWEPRTTDELIAECEKPQERELMCYLQ